MVLESLYRMFKKIRSNKQGNLWLFFLKNGQGFVILVLYEYKDG